MIERVAVGRCRKAFTMAMLLGAAWIGQGSARAMLIEVDGVPLEEISVPGTRGNAIADGYDLLNDAIPSSFSSNFLVLGDETKSSDPIQISDIPYTSIGGLLYFAFVYDLQETKRNESVIIDDVTISVPNGTEIWSTTEPILLNFENGGVTTNLTLKPLGNGADMALFIPVSAFAGFGLKGSDSIIFTSTQSLSHNGNDEWILTDGGVVRPGCDGTQEEGTECAPLEKFDPEDDVTAPTPPVPEPSTVFLLGAGCLFLAVTRSRR